jgi:hypothetical protein
VQLLIVNLWENFSLLSPLLHGNVSCANKVFLLYCRGIDQSLTSGPSITLISSLHHCRNLILHLHLIWNFYDEIDSLVSALDNPAWCYGILKYLIFLWTQILIHLHLIWNFYDEIVSLVSVLDNPARCCRILKYLIFPWIQMLIPVQAKDNQTLNGNIITLFFIIGY